jgi:putative serine protease PepD
MSDEQREQGRDASASTDGPRTDQHPAQSYAPGSENTVPAMGPNHMGAPAGAEHPAGNPYQQSTASYPPPNGGFPYGPPPPTPGRPPRKPRTMVGIVAAALIAGLVGGGAAFGGAYALTGNHPVNTVLTSSPASPASTNATPGTVAAARSTSASTFLRARPRAAA